MRTRQEIKAIGKAQFKANYWPCVLALLLITIAIGLLTSLANSGTTAQMQEVTQAAMSGREPDVHTTLTFGSFIGSLALIILNGPLTVGVNAFFVKNTLGRFDEISMTTPFTAAFQNFGRKLGGYLWMVLFTFLWALLFWIPGFIKAFSYAMTPYILCDCPNVKAKDALKLSMRIMKGHKWEMFVMELSFIGWGILSGLTFGILDIFYVGPYMQSSFATYYLEVREQALRTGVITMGQLEGVEPV